MTNIFHPIIIEWFRERFHVATEPQTRGWPEIIAGNHTLIAAPTGSGKTLAAFLVCIDRLLKAALDGQLEDSIQVVYVSPLKALSNDIRRNLDIPLQEIEQVAARKSASISPIRVTVRTGDTPVSERQRMLKKPPHILVTTPESLFILLTAAKSREALKTVKTVIVDEIHTLARDKRGSHLSLTLERLEALSSTELQRIGLSATQKPLNEIARFLVGTRNVDKTQKARCSVLDIGHLRELDLTLEVPSSELSAVCSNETWGEIYRRLVQLIKSHRSTLIFVNTRRLAERLSYQLTELLDSECIASHHGSLSRKLRLRAEERLKAGNLKAIVATASLELGIDIGFVDLVCQIGSPRSIATLLQRIGRSGHSLGKVPKGRLFPLTRDEHIEALALLRSVKHGRLDEIEIPSAPLAVLAQQIVAAVACEEWFEDDLFELCRYAWPYNMLTRDDFDIILDVLSDGIVPDRRQAAYLHRDRINRKLRPRRNARLAAITSGGVIPENAEFRVVTEDGGTFVGTVDEDFALESIAGDIFLLGNRSWRIRHVRGGEVMVRDAQGAPPSIPFWFGEAPARTDELSEEVSVLREEIGRRLNQGVGQRSTDEGSGAGERLQRMGLANQGQGKPQRNELSARDGQRSTGYDRRAAKDVIENKAVSWLMVECDVDERSAQQAVNYVQAEIAALGLVPTRETIVFERFFDESGGMQMVIHAPYGARINKAWGLTFRKRFCRSFNFELQAAADDNGIILSLGPQHSFPLESMFRILNPENATHLLVQAVLAVPMFRVRWRWTVTRALAVRRMKNGKKVPPALQRFRADDLLSMVFPTATACLEHIVGDIELPNHPYIQQTLRDCLYEAMDANRWIDVLKKIEEGKVQLISRDTREPSPFSHELLNARPYAFLDDAPLEERRTRAVQTRRVLDVDAAHDLGWLDPKAIAQVRMEVVPDIRNCDELHDLLLSAVVLPEREGYHWREWFNELKGEGRATVLRTDDGSNLWVATERLALVRAAYTNAQCEIDMEVPEYLKKAYSASEAWIALVRGRLEMSGPTTAAVIANALRLGVACVNSACEALEGEGFVLRGRFHKNNKPAGNQTQELDTSADEEVEWCERRLLARIHRLTLEGLRQQIEPVSLQDYARFLLEHHHLTRKSRLDDGREAVLMASTLLQGVELPISVWENEIFPARISRYESSWLDELTLSGVLMWCRLHPAQNPDGCSKRFSGVRSNVPISIIFRSDLPWLLSTERTVPESALRVSTRRVYEVLRERGALFFEELQTVSGLLSSQVEAALVELTALGFVTADGFANIRAMVMPARGRRSVTRRKSRMAGFSRSSFRAGGRWSIFPGAIKTEATDDAAEYWARLLLKRYGIVSKDLLYQERVAPPWRTLLPIYRRLELRGEIRGGLFVKDMAGEQFAIPENVEQLRKTRSQKKNRSWQVVSAIDPAGIVSLLNDQTKISARPSNRVAFLDGRVVATIESGVIRFYETLDLGVSNQISLALRKNALARTKYEEAGIHTRIGVA